MQEYFNESCLHALSH